MAWQSLLTKETELQPVIREDLSYAERLEQYGRDLSGDFDVLDVNDVVANAPKPINARANARQVQAKGSGQLINVTDNKALAESLGLPESVTALLPEEVKSRQVADALASMPKLAEWGAGGRANAVLAAQNVQQMRATADGFAPYDTVEDLRQKMEGYNDWTPITKGLAEGVSNLNIGLYNGTIDILKSMIALPTAAVEMTAGEDSGLAKLLRRSIELWDRQKFQYNPTTTFLGQLITDVATNAPQYAFEIGATWMTMGLLGATGKAARIGATARAAAVGEGLTAEAAEAAGVAAARKFTMDWGIKAGAGFAGSNIFGMSYLEHTSNGISPGNAAMAAGVNAALQMQLEKIGIKGWLKTLEQKTAGKILRAGAAAGTKEFFTEAAQEMPEYLTRFWANSSLEYSSMQARLAWTWQQATDADNFVQGTKDAIYSGTIGFILGGGMGTGHAAISKFRPAKNQYQYYQGALANEVVNRLSLQRGLDAAFGEAQTAPSGKDRVGMSEMLRNVIPTNCQTLYITPEDLQSLQNQVNLPYVLNMDQPEIDRAIRDGKTLEVNTADVISANNDEARTVADHLRARPDGISGRDAKAWDAEQQLNNSLMVFNMDIDLPEFTRSEAEAAIAEAARNEQAAITELNQEIVRLKQELFDANVVNKEEINKHMEVLKSHALAFQKAYGIDALTFFRSLHVEKGQAQPGQTTPYGQFEVRADQRILRLFDNRNSATITHESGHIMVDNLWRALLAGDRNAFDLYIKRLTSFKMDGLAKNFNDHIANGGDLAGFVQELANELESNKRTIKKLSDSLTAIQNRLANARPEYTDKAALTKQMEDIRQQIAKLQGNNTDLRRAIYHGRVAMNQQAALGQAEADLRALCDHAGVLFEELEFRLRPGPDGEVTFTDSTSRKLYREFQEKTAKAFERYVALGKGPSKKLAPVFNRLKVWLLNFYQDIVNISPQDTTEEVRQAFNRMLATEDEIFAIGANSDVYVNEANLLNVGWMNITPQDQANLQAELQNSRATQRQDMYDEARAKAEKFRKKRLAVWRKQLANDPFWRMVDKHKFLFSEAEAMLGQRPAEELRQAHPELFDDVNGSRADTVALMTVDATGNPIFQDGKNVFQELYDRLYQKRQTRESEALKNADLDTHKYLLGQSNDIEAGLADAYGKFQSRVSEMFLKAFAGARFTGQEVINQWVNQAQMPQARIDLQAEANLANLPFRQISDALINRQINSILKQREEAWQAKNLEKFLEAHNRLRVAIAMKKKLALYRQENEKDMRYFRRVANAGDGTYTLEAVEALRKVYDFFGLGHVRAIGDQAIAGRSLRDLLQSLCGQNINSQGQSGANLDIFEDWLVDLVNPNPGKDLEPANYTPRQVEQIKGLVQFIVNNSNNATKAAAQARENMLESTKQTIIGTLMNVANKDYWKHFRAAQEVGDKFYSTVTHLSQHCMKLDGLQCLGDMGGVACDMLRQVIQGEQRVKDRIEHFLEKTHPAFRQLGQRADWLVKKFGKDNVKKLRVKIVNGEITYEATDEIQAPERIRKGYGRNSFTVDEVISLAFNCGNDDNIKRIVSGYPDLTYDALAELLGDDMAMHINDITGIEPSPINMGRDGLLTAADWQAIQTIWDAVESSWDDLAAAHEKQYQFRPAKVYPSAFTLKFSDGTFANCSGGYFPIRYDGQISRRVAMFNEHDFEQSNLDSLFRRARAPHGFTMTRETRTNYPLLLDSSQVLSRHLDQEARFIELGEIAKFMDDVTSDPAVAHNYIETYGKDDYDKIRPNLRALVMRDEPSDVISDVERKLRPFSVVAGLGLNFKVAIIQLSAIFSTMNDKGTGVVLQAMGQILAHPIEMMRQIYKVAPYIHSRIENWDQDLNDILGRINLKRAKTFVFRGVEYSYADVVKIVMLPITIVDQFASMVCWLASYNKSLQDQALAAANAQNQQGQPNPNPTPQPAPGPTPTPGPQPAPGPNPQNQQGTQQNQQNIQPAPPFQRQPLQPQFQFGNTQGVVTPQQRFRQRQNQHKPAKEYFDTTNPFHEKAVADANMSTKQANPDADRSSSTYFGRGTGVARIFNMFSGGINLLADRFNYMWTAWRKGAITNWEFARYAFFEGACPSLMMMIIFGLMRGYGGEGDKDDEFKKFAAGCIADQVSTFIPIGGKFIAQGALGFLGLDQYAGRFSGLESSLATPIRFMNTALKSGGDLLFDFDNLTPDQKEHALVNIGALLGYFAKIPGDRLRRNWVKGWEQEAEGRGTDLSFISPR